MKTGNLTKSISRSIHKAGFQLKKHSPEILVVVGVAGVVTSAVMACKATLKVNEVIDNTKKDIEKIHTATEKGVTEAGKPYTEEDSKKDLTIVYTQTGVKLAKMYAPSVALGALSIVGIVSSHRILRKRNIALAAAYTAVEKTFKDYRGRVIERFGKELDRELKYNIRNEQIEEKVVDENGKETTVTRTVQIANIPHGSAYARFFDETCPNWEKDANYNKSFLLMQQSYANEVLRTRGHLFLNEVYDMLGMQRTPEGQVVGWVYDNEAGDNYVDFGIFDLYDDTKRAFVNGFEKSILLDFNVDGDILPLMQ